MQMKVRSIPGSARPVPAAAAETTDPLVTSHTSAEQADEEMRLLFSEATGAACLKVGLGQTSDS